MKAFLTWLFMLEENDWFFTFARCISMDATGDKIKMNYFHNFVPERTGEDKVVLFT